MLAVQLCGNTLYKLVCSNCADTMYSESFAPYSADSFPMPAPLRHVALNTTLKAQHGVGCLRSYREGLDEFARPLGLYSVSD